MSERLRGEAGGCPTAEAHVFDVAGRIEVFFVLGEAFYIVF